MPQGGKSKDNPSGHPTGWIEDRRSNEPGKPHCGNCLLLAAWISNFATWLIFDIPFTITDSHFSGKYLNARKCLPIQYVSHFILGSKSSHTTFGNCRRQGLLPMNYPRRTAIQIYAFPSREARNPCLRVGAVIGRFSFVN